MRNVMKCLAIASPFLLSWQAMAATLTVPDGYATIQAAIDAAVDGTDDIAVAAGTYTEQLLLNKSITINGANAGIAAGVSPGARGAETIIDGGFIVSGAAILDGLQIINGRASGSVQVGVAVATSGVTIQNSIIQDVGVGPAVSQSDGISTQPGNNSLTLTNSTIYNNWRGIYLNPGDGHLFTGNLIDANNGVGVGIGSDGQTNLTLSGNTISNNTVEGWGSSAVGAGVVAENNSFINNGVDIAHYGGNTIDASPNYWDGNAPVNVSGDVDVLPYWGDVAMTESLPLPLVVDAGWEAFVIRAGSNSGDLPYIWGNDNHVANAVEFVIFEGGQKAGLGTDLISGALVSQISTLHVDRLDDINASGSLYGPYFNMWVTDGLGNYAVLSNEPSDAEWAGSRWDVSDWNFLKTKRCKVYETPGWNSNSSWVHAIAGNDPFNFEAVGGLIIEAPPVAYINDTNNGVGSGAPDVLGTSEAYGFNWIFGDTANNYVSGGGEGFVVDGYSATADFPVYNVTQDLYYGTIAVAIAAANPGDVIEVSSGTYTGSIVIDKALTLTGLTGATIVGDSNIAVTIDADNVTISGFTISNPNNDFGIFSQDDNGVTITNNVVTNVGPSDATSSSSNSGIAVVSSGAAVDGVTITGNTIHQIDGGEYTSANGIAIGWSNGAFDITNVLIQENTIYDIDSNISDWPIGRGAYGILINHARSSYAGRTVGAIIRDNTIEDLEGLWVHGIGLEGDTPNALVHGNILDDFVDHKSPSDAIGVFFEDNDYVATALIEHNSFTNISWAIGTHPSTAVGTVDAPLNWYGSNDAGTVAATVFGDIDYSPWLASGTDIELGTAGFQPDLSTLWVGPGGSIQDAIDSVVGSTVYVAPGTYTENIAISTHVNLVGSGSDASPVSNTILVGTLTLTGSGASHADPLRIEDLQIQPTSYAINMTATLAEHIRLDNVSLQGDGTSNLTGLKVSSAAGVNDLAIVDCAFDYLKFGWYISKNTVHGDNNVSNVTVENTSFSNNWSKAIYAEKLSDASFTNCTVVDNGTASSYSDGGFDINLKYETTYQNLSFTGCLFDGNGLGSRDGVALTFKARDDGSYASPPAALNNVDVINCVITGNERGIRIGEPGKDSPATTNVTVTGCNISGNVQTYGGVDGSAYGGLINECSTTADARGNWWGDASGPYHTPDNLPGTGNAVVELTGTVLFNPFLTGLVAVMQDADENLISVDDNGATYPSTTDLTLSVNTTPGTAWRGTSIKVLYDPVYLSFAYPAGFSNLFVYDQNPQVYVTLGTVGALNSITIDAAILGAGSGVTTPVDICALTFDAIAEPASPFTTPIQLGDVEVRDMMGAPIMPITVDEDEVITIDGADPAISFTSTLYGGDCVNTDVSWDLSASDLFMLGKVEYILDTDSPVVVADNINATTWSGTQNQGIGTLGQGLHTVTFIVTDKVGNVIDSPITDTFIIDTVAPVAASNIDLDIEWDTDHYNVNLFWDAASGNVAIKVYRALRAGYPYLGGATSTATTPNVYGVDAYELIATLGAGATSHVDDFTVGTAYSRAICDYAVVAYDCANNSSAALEGASTNYFLGDWADSPYDGRVFSDDLAQLSTSYGTASGDTYFNAEHNVGPTEDFSNYGLPAPDNRINFEDLILFSMNYGQYGPELPQDNTVPASGVVQLLAGAEHPELVLPAGLKGLSVHLVSDAALTAVNSTYPVFFYNDGEAWVVDVVALSATLPEGTRLELVFAEATTVEILSVDGRSFTNQTVELTSENALSGELPAQFELAQNYPNPFNPTTRIRYALPEAADVRMVLFNSLGQEVRTLVSGSHEAGWHELHMDATGLASGIYFYRIEAGHFMDLKKMVLIK